MGQPFARYAEFDLAAQFIRCFINIDGMTFEAELPGNTHSRRSSADDSYRVAGRLSLLRRRELERKASHPVDFERLVEVRP